MACYLTHFSHIRPNQECQQEDILRWIAHAHVHAESRVGGSKAQDPHFDRELLSILLRVGSGKGKIQKRGIHFPDILHENWEEMEIFNFNHGPSGHGHSKRCAYFAESSAEILEKFYPLSTPLPSHLIHVTCTGYAAPSAVQSLVAKRKAATSITHAYHMGCYASLPAIRIAAGLLPTHASPIDIVHTEICSLHLNPLVHTKEQLVIQSLFGDGFIRYSMVDKPDHPSLRVLTIAEQLIAETEKCMQWHCADWGMEMSLSHDVPTHISNALPQFINTLAAKIGMTFNELKSKAIFAIHPGGPKIIDSIQNWLELDKTQTILSREVLCEMGNMSSATLPHIWEKIVKDESIANGTLIVSLAFGPGLTLFGSIFERTK